MGRWTDGAGQGNYPFINESMFVGSRAGVNTISISNISRQRNAATYAEVMSILLDEKEPGSIGIIKAHTDTNENIFALPLSSNIRAYPVIGEIVSIISIGTQYYYSYPSNIFNYINNNESHNSVLIINPDTKTTQESQNSTLSSKIPNAENEGVNEFKIGKDIKDNKNIPVLLPKEGELIIQGRFGNALRFGFEDADKNLPTIKTSLLSNNNTEFVAVKEDLNNDTCIWMTSNETVSFEKPNTDISSKNDVSNVYDGEQIILSSGRIIFNSKKNEIFLFSRKGIHNACDLNFSVDSGKSIIMNSVSNIELESKDNIILKSPNSTIIKSEHIYLGDTENVESMVKGDTLQDILDKLISAILNITVPTVGGPSGTVINAAEFSKIKSSLRNILSTSNFTK